MTKILSHTLLASVLIGAIGCYAEGPDPQYTAEADGDGDLVEVSPGLEVIADAPEPIFFTDGFYWVNRGGFWYSSTWYGGGWAVNAHPPGVVIGIHNPGMYAHWHPEGYVGHEHVRGGYANHAQYHATHAAAGSYHVRAAVHSSSHASSSGRHR